MAQLMRHQLIKDAFQIFEFIGARLSSSSPARLKKFVAVTVLGRQPR